MASPIEPTETTQRIDSLDVEHLRPEWRQTLERIPGAGLKGDGFPRHVLGVLMHSPDTFGPFLEYWVTCKEKMALTVREQELVILRMGTLYGSEYVWKHHVPVGREFGMTDDELVAVRDGDIAVFGQREAALIALTDELVDARTIRREAWDRHTSVLSPRDVVDLIQLVAQYVLFALANNAAQVQVEASLGDVPGLNDPISRS
jgi:alkylhydroperoxidase family enzyme